VRLKSFGLAFGLHLLAIGLGWVWLARPSPTAIPALEVAVLPGIEFRSEGDGDTAQGPSKLVPKLRVAKGGTKSRERRDAQIRGLFGPDPWEGINSPTGTTHAGRGDVPDESAVLPQLGFERDASGGGGHVTVRSPLRPLAQALDRSLRFEANLYREHERGSVQCRFRVTEEGRLAGVKARGAEKYLIVYLLKTLEELFETQDGLALVETPWLNREVLLTVRFVTKRGREFGEPLPQLARGRIDMERRRQVSGRVQLGPGEMIAMAAEKGGISLSLPLEIESWFSASHRKRYGLSGKKRAETDERVWRETFDRMYDRYVARGWVEI